MTTNNPNPEEYNGYPNYQTWAASLWIDNDEGSYDYWKEQAQSAWDDATSDEIASREQRARWNLAEMLKTQHEEDMPDVSGVYSDLLTSALGRVDWYCIAQNMLDEVDKTEEDDEEEDTDDEEDEEAE